jgi:hypothetical protein
VNAPSADVQAFPGILTSVLRSIRHPSTQMRSGLHRFRLRRLLPLLSLGLILAGCSTTTSTLAGPSSPDVCANVSRAPSGVPAYVKLIQSSVERQSDNLVMRMVVGGPLPAPAKSDVGIATTVWYFFIADHANHADSYLALVDADPKTGQWSYLLTYSPDGTRPVGGIPVRGRISRSAMRLTVSFAELSHLSSRVDWSAGADLLVGPSAGDTICPATPGSVMSSDIVVPRAGRPGEGTAP